MLRRVERAGQRRQTAGRVVLPVILLGGLLVSVAGSGERSSPPAALFGLPDGSSGSWTLAWHDEFDGPGLDRDRWQPNRYGVDGGDAPFVPAAEEAWFSPSMVDVEDGNLVLTIRTDPRRLHGRTYQFSSGVVQSTESHSVRPVTYVEARLSVPECDGCWPAFWLTPLDRWPPEIDILEFYDSAQHRRPSFNYHLPLGGRSGPVEYGDPAVDYRQGFHTYGVLWDGERAVPYVDGQPYPAAAADRAMTELPSMVILNLSVLAGHQPPDGSQMRVDWVRVWTPDLGARK